MKIKLTTDDKPAPEAVKHARLESGMSQKQAAELVHLSGYQRWAEYERGTHAMDLARWELFLLLTGQHPTLVSSPKRSATNV